MGIDDPYKDIYPSFIKYLRSLIRDSFTSPYADYILEKIPGIRGRLIPHV